MGADTKKTTLRMIPYGLYVLTVAAEDSVGSGTVNWVSQMSFEPPLLALGVKTDTKSFANVQAGGAMALSDTLAWAELRLRETVEIGDHAVVVAEVTDVGPRSEDRKVLTLKELGLNYGG